MSVAAARAPAGRRSGVAVIGSPANETTIQIVDAWNALGVDTTLMSPKEALAELGPGDIAVARLDVRPSLDGVEEGLLAVLLLERRGVDVRNTAESLLNTHDKLRTARLFARAGLPHPPTIAIPGRGNDTLQPPFVVKPRFGSWGAEVVLCPDYVTLGDRLHEIRSQPWFRRHGAIVQTAIPNGGRDLRVIVAGGRVVGAAERVAAPGEWRTNVSCGGSLQPTGDDERAFELARTAAAVAGTDIAGVDVLPVEGGGYTLIELNGAVEFDPTYSLGERDVYARAVAALDLPVTAQPTRIVRASEAAPSLNAR